MNIVFHKIQRENIFCSDFENMISNNRIDFSDCGIVIIYGPNGVGKTSLTKTFGNELNSQCEFLIDDKTIINQEDSIFHIIEDQNGRNIIKGSTEDFILGDNIKREYELKHLIDSGFDDIFLNKLIPELKQEFGISTKTNRLISKIADQILSQYITDLANMKSKGKLINRGEFINKVESLTKIAIPNFEDKKFNFLINDYKNENSIIEKILNLDFQLIKKKMQIFKKLRNTKRQ